MSWHEVPGADALGEDEAMGVVLSARPVALVRSGGKLHALHNICTHQLALLSDGYVEDGCIECPLHQGRFDLRTGAPKAPPVTEPVRVYPVKTESGKVYVDLGD
ncbi:MAG TPA: non-heme iron oxygenase ferredoxin subunit [Burkholderiales bacterium]|nr:non-heme iron oxygenase ferredoxin subunit [Burkholderiales bacterium]